MHIGPRKPQRRWIPSSQQRTFALSAQFTTGNFIVIPLVTCLLNPSRTSNMAWNAEQPYKSYRQRISFWLSSCGRLGGSRSHTFGLRSKDGGQLLRLRGDHIKSFSMCMFMVQVMNGVDRDLDKVGSHRLGM